MLCRFPLIITLPSLWARWLRKDHDEHTREPEREAGIKFLCGATIATVEATITCPLERLKVLLITRTRTVPPNRFVFSGHVAHYYRSLVHRRISHSAETDARCSIREQGVMRYMMRGFTPLLFRQLVSWITFLVADSQCKQSMRQLTHQDTLSLPALGVVAVAGE